MYLPSETLFDIFELFFKMLLGLTIGEKLQVKEFFCNSFVTWVQAFLAFAPIVFIRWNACT